MIEEIRLLSNPEEVQRIYDFVKQYPLDYPDYYVWLEKCRKQLKMGEKKVFYATNGDLIIGSAIFQKHRDEESVLEIKNLRVSKESAGKGVASALEFMICSYARSNGFKRIRGDTHHDNFPIIQFLRKREYFLEGEETLYVADQPEIILAKDL